MKIGVSDGGFVTTSTTGISRKANYIITLEEILSFVTNFYN
jgi:hypothetical protein